MCTLIVLHRSLAGRPLVVAANRDEFLTRPAEGPALRQRGAGVVLAPLDLEAGGTWLGLNAQGVFVGLTNLRPLPVSAHRRRDGGGDRKVADGRRLESERGVESLAMTGLRSRGEVVMAALDAASASEGTRMMRGLEEDAYNPFQLLIADRHDASLTIYRSRSETKPLSPGVHVVGNVEEERIPAALGAAATELPDLISDRDRVGDSEQPKARKLTRIRERVEKMMAEPGRDLLEGLADICREHADPGISPFESTCVHVADRYGTRSSFLLELADVPETSRLWATDGPPCERSFEDLSDLLAELDGRSSASNRSTLNDSLTTP